MTRIQYMQLRMGKPHQHTFTLFVSSLMSSWDEMRVSAVIKRATLRAIFAAYRLEHTFLVCQTNMFSIAFDLSVDTANRLPSPLCVIVNVVGSVFRAYRASLPADSNAGSDTSSSFDEHQFLQSLKGVLKRHEILCTKFAAKSRYGQHLWVQHYLCRVYSAPIICL